MTAGAVHELTWPSGTIRVTVSAASHLGLVRKVNEDSYLAKPPFFLVADGMGGHSFGDRASQSLVASFAAAIGDGSPPNPEHVVEIIRSANETILAQSADDTVSGTTLSGLALVMAANTPSWMVFNVGDSRVYSWDGSTLKQLTIDHSAIQEMLELGQITPVEAIAHPYRNVVTRAIGVHESVNPDICLLPIDGKQMFLACSDGLTKELDDESIAAILADRASLPAEHSIADNLVRAALAAGGSDNVTVVVVDSEWRGIVPSAPADHN